MDGVYTCEKHDLAVVVYPQRVRDRPVDCPLCVAETRIGELEKRVEELEDDISKLTPGP